MERRKTNANEILTTPVTCCARLDHSLFLFSSVSLFLSLLPPSFSFSFSFVRFAVFFYSSRFSLFSLFYFVPYKNLRGRTLARGWFLHRDAAPFRASRRRCVQMTCQIVITPRFKRLYTSRLALTETWFWHFVCYGRACAVARTRS